MWVLTLPASSDSKQPWGLGLSIPLPGCRHYLLQVHTAPACRTSQPSYCCGLSSAQPVSLLNRSGVTFSSALACTIALRCTFAAWWSPARRLFHSSRAPAQASHLCPLPRISRHIQIKFKKRNCLKSNEMSASSSLLKSSQALCKSTLEPEPRGDGMHLKLFLYS